MISTKIRGLNKALKELRAISLTPAEKKKLLRGAGQIILKASKKRLTSQTNLDGSKFAKRKSKSRKKMLRGFKKFLRILATDKSVKIYLRRGGKIASEHHFGATIKVKRRGNKKAG